MRKKFWAAVIFAVIASLSIFTAGVSAEVIASGDCGNQVKWSLDDNGTLTISGSGDMWDFPSSPFTGYKSSIKYVLIEDGVTSIGNHSFSSSSSYGVNNAYPIERVKIGNSVTRIGDYAFSFCPNLSKITFGSSVISIGTNAFHYCGSLNEINIPYCVKSIGSNAFSACGLSYVELSDSVETISDYAFGSCVNLVRVKLGNGLKKIGNNAFNNCSKLNEIAFPTSLELIGQYAFTGCKALTNIIIPQNVERIENGAFHNCTSLKEIQFSSSLDSIGVDAFYGCNPTTIYYTGSEFQWDEVFIARGNDKIKETKKVFSTPGNNNTVPVIPSQPDVSDKNGNCILIYDANGGIEPPIPVTVKNGEAVTISAEKLSRIGYEFLGWSKQSSAVKAEYIGGENLTLTGNLTLYAVWKKIGGYSVEMVLTIDSNNAKINGTDAYTDVAPIIENSRTMLPARFVAEKLGASVTWDDAARKVIITGADGTVIEITIDSATALVNGKEIALDAPAFIRDSRTYTPVRFICDNLGADVGWDGEKREVTIRK